MTDETVHYDESFNRKTRAMVIQLRARVARRPGRWRRAMRGRRCQWDEQHAVQPPERLRAA